MAEAAAERADFEKILRERLIQTGQWQEAQRHLRTKLKESGWEDKVRASAEEQAGKQGQQPSLKALVGGLTAEATSNLPPSVRAEMVKFIKDCIYQNIEHT